MKVANIGDLKNNLSKFIGFVEQMGVVQICKHNMPWQSWYPMNYRKLAIIPGLDVVREP